MAALRAPLTLTPAPNPADPARPRAVRGEDRPDPAFRDLLAARREARDAPARAAEASNERPQVTQRRAPPQRPERTDPQPSEASDQSAEHTNRPADEAAPQNSRGDQDADAIRNGAQAGEGDGARLEANEAEPATAGELPAPLAAAAVQAPSGFLLAEFLEPLAPERAQSDPEALPLTPEGNPALGLAPITAPLGAQAAPSFALVALAQAAPGRDLGQAQASLTLAGLDQAAEIPIGDFQASELEPVANRAGNEPTKPAGLANTPGFPPPGFPPLGAAAQAVSAQASAPRKAAEEAGSTNADAALLAPSAPQATGNASQASASANAQAARPVPHVPTIAREIVHQVKDGARSFELRLDPIELGKIHIRLDIAKDNSVSATLTADNPQTLADLARGARDLERALSQAGLQLGQNGLSFDLARRDAQGDRDRSTRTVEASGPARAIGAQAEASPARAAQERWINARINLIA